MKNQNRNKIKKVSRIILTSMFYAGAFMIAATSPSFSSKIIPAIIKHLALKLSGDKSDKMGFYNSFYYLNKKGLIKAEYKNHQLFISLTEAGKKYAQKYQIDDLEIKKPEKWDHKWRILIFDVKEKHRIKRDALRGKLIELGLFKLQDSVWVCPYDFQKEVDFLRNFFGLTKDEMKLIISTNIEDDIKIKYYFRL